MEKIPLDQEGMGVMEFLVWVAVAAVLGWLGWQLYQHPESLHPSPENHSVLEDTQPPNH